MAAIAVGPRLQPGTAGRRIKVSTNSFLIVQRPTVTFYQYDVMIEKISVTRTGPARAGPAGEVLDPTLANPRRNGEILEKMQRDHAQEFHPTFVYDGKKSLFSPKNLGGLRNYTVSLVPNSDRANYKVTLTQVLTIQPSTVDDLLRGGWTDYDKTKVVINLLQLILRAQPLAQGHTVTARAVFPRNNNSHPIISMTDGIDLLRGYWQSVRPAAQGLVVQIDTSMTAMYASGSSLDIALRIVSEDMRRRGIDPRVLIDVPTRNTVLWKKLISYFKGLRFVSHMNPNRVGRVQTIKGLVENAGGYKFVKDGVETTVADYCLQLTGKQLQFPRVFGIVTGRDKDVIIPAECAFIVPGQLYRKKMSPDIMKKLLELSKKRPDERFRLISNGQGPDALAYSSSAYMHLTQMQVSKTALQVNGRVLDTPKVHYGGADPQRPDVLEPKLGAWNVMNRRFVSPATISNWAVVNLDSGLDDATMMTFLKELNLCLTKLGVRMPPHVPAIVKHSANDVDAAMAEGLKFGLRASKDALQKNARSKGAPESEIAKVKGLNPTIYVVILPQIAPDPRRAIKSFGDIIWDIPTQCVNAARILSQTRGFNQYANNIALKINVKCGGLNSYVAPNDADFAGWMVLGADVGHASPGALRPSMAGLVSSVDKYATRYTATSAIQMPRTETIENLENMVASALYNYADFYKGKQWPDRLLFYRDGISEGEFGPVKDQEVEAIHAAVQAVKAKYNLPAEYKPTLTYVVVGKRHHTRFCPSSPQEADRSGNCPAGMVVDRDLSNPLVFDFYLQSHAGLLGTSRPAHYSLLHDENGFTADILQRYTYALCHVYARATRAVSIPAPVYYADLVCSRSEYHYNPEFDQGASDAGSVDSRGRETFDEARLLTWRRNFLPAKLNQSRMFYFM